MLGKRVRRKILPFASLLLLAIAASGYALLRLSLPKLEGEVAAAGLSAPVTVARDARGTPTLTGRTRADLAFALGYLHGQERFFQMGPSINPIFLQRLRQEGAMSGFGLDWDCGLSGMFWRFCVQVSDFWLSSGDCSSCGCKCGVGAAREEDKT
jgi:hypothetical protein